jgi:hypothetical protein
MLKPIIRLGSFSTKVRLPYRPGYEDFTMAEINKLSVGQAIDKLRGKDAPKSEMEQLDQKIEELEVFDTLRRQAVCEIR